MGVTVAMGTTGQCGVVVSGSCRSLFLFLLFHLSPCFIFFCLSASTLSSVSCSPGAILGLHTQEEGMFSSVGLSQYLPGWPFVLSVLLAFV